MFVLVRVRNGVALSLRLPGQRHDSAMLRICSALLAEALHSLADTANQASGALNTWLVLVHECRGCHRPM